MRRRGGGSGVTSEQFSVAVFPVVGLAPDPGLQEKVVAAVGHRLGEPGQAVMSCSWANLTVSPVPVRSRWSSSVATIACSALVSR